MKLNLIFRTVQKGFTLVELLIVAIILSILAAIALPQFSSSADDAQLAALDYTLGNIRSAIYLYAQQHDGDYPGFRTAVVGSCAAGGGVAGPGANGDSIATFMEQLTRYSNAAGQTCTVSDANFRFGPYLKKDVFPANPVTGIATIEFLDTTTGGILGMTGTGAAGGWKYAVQSGQFIANDTDFIDGSTAPSFDQL